MSPKLNPRKNLRRQQQSEEDLPATARVPAYSASAKTNDNAKVNRSRPWCGCGFCSRHCDRRKPRKSVVVLLTVSTMFLLNGVRISLPWPPYNTSRTNAYRYNPRDRREGVYPRLVQYAMDGSGSLQILDPMAKYDGSSSGHLQLYLPKWQLMSQHENNDDSSDYEYELPDPFETADCKAQHPWQLATYPTCNTLHELDTTRLNSFDPRATQKFSIPRLEYLAHGYWRDIWSVRELRFQKQHHHHQQQQTQHEIYNIVLKTMRYTHDFVGRNYDRHRRDALAAERLTKSDSVVDIYGFCGNSGLFEYGDGGDIANAVWSKDGHDLTQVEKLVIGMCLSFFWGSQTAC